MDHLFPQVEYVYYRGSFKLSRDTSIYSLELGSEIKLLLQLTWCSFILIFLLDMSY